MTTRRLVALFPQLLGDGGVQRLGRQMVHGLLLATRARGMELVVLSMVDPPSAVTLEVTGGEVPMRGFGRNRAELAVAYRHAAMGAAGCWLGHPYQAPLAMMALVPRRPPPYLVHAHGIEVWERMPWLRRKGLQGAAVVSTSSVYTGREVVRLQGVDPVRVATLYPALEPRFGLDGAVGECRPVMLAVTRMAAGDRGKNLDHAIRAFARVAADVPEWTFEIVGDGADRARLEEIARTEGLSSRVIFRGRVTDDELRCLYRDAAVFCLPSTKEGFGIVYLEAMANGIPVLAADIGAIPEVVTHGRTGLLAPPCDDAALAANMRAMMGDAAMRARMAAAGVEGARGFSLDAFCTNVDQLVGRLLGGPP